MLLTIIQKNGDWQMDKQEIELIKKMVIHGIYKVCLMNGYDSTMFRKFKDEQNILFANYEFNHSLLEYDKALSELQNSLQKKLKG